jgi:hypothetical protein
MDLDLGAANVPASEDENAVERPSAKARAVTDDSKRGIAYILGEHGRSACSRSRLGGESCHLVAEDCSMQLREGVVRSMYEACGLEIDLRVFACARPSRVRPQCCEPRCEGSVVGDSGSAFAAGEDLGCLKTEDGDVAECPESSPARVGCTVTVRAVFDDLRVGGPATKTIYVDMGGIEVHCENRVERIRINGTV